MEKWTPLWGNVRIDNRRRLLIPKAVADEYFPQGIAVFVFPKENTSLIGLRPPKKKCSAVASKFYKGRISLPKRGLAKTDFSESEHLNKEFEITCYTNSANDNEEVLYIDLSKPVT